MFHDQPQGVHSCGVAVGMLDFLELGQQMVFIGGRGVYNYLSLDFLRFSLS